MRLFPPFIALLLMLLFMVSGGGYLAEQGRYLFAYALRARPVEKVLADPGVSSETRRLLETAAAVRSFAAERIGLKTGRSFGVYVETGKEHLVDVVTACRSDAFEARTWRFPIVGEAPYKGFYRKERAEKLAADLREEGWDVIIRPVDAFSSLGFFPDPLFDFMRGYSEYDLADLIIHELTHKTVFVRGKAQFNEELATFVGIEGAIQYLEAESGRGAAVREELARAGRDRERFLELMRGLYAELDGLYRGDLPRSDKLEAKKRILEEFRSRMEREYDTLFQTDSYRFLARTTLNNAYILSWNIYAGDLEPYRELLDRYDGDLSLFMQAIAALRKRGGDPRREMRLLPE